MYPLHHNSRGAAAIYLVLLLTFMFTSSALIISFSLSRQLRASSEVADSARAFYAATSGLEQGLMELVTNPEANQVVTISGTIPYDDTEATYSGEGRFIASPDDANILLPCVAAQGKFRTQQRRAELGGTGIGCSD